MPETVPALVKAVAMARVAAETVIRHHKIQGCKTPMTPHPVPAPGTVPEVPTPEPIPALAKAFPMARVTVIRYHHNIQGCKAATTPQSVPAPGPIQPLTIPALAKMVALTRVALETEPIPALAKMWAVPILALEAIVRSH